ncbi:hypothetical protein ACJJTC_018148 [Scirpophaga incertulas]
MRCVLALALFSTGLFLVSGHGVNYCGAKMCGHSNSHTFCQYLPGASPKCVGYIDALLSSDEKARILARLNRRRSEAAAGRLRNKPTAGDMLKLRWVDELAREAQRWADQCRLPRSPEEQDDCRDLFGQCVASVVGEAPGLKVETMVDLWYMQSMLYNGNISSYVAPGTSDSYYDDFAQMIWANSYMVGCGRSRFMTDWNGRARSVERLVCNIAPRGPLPGRPLWTPAPPASACPPRAAQDPQLPTLCTFQADIDASADVNGSMTIEEHILLSTVLDIEANESPNYVGRLDELYLTKIAIVTMEDTDVTDAPINYNPIQKRDAVDRRDVNGSSNDVVHTPKTYDIEDLSHDQCRECIATEQTNLDLSTRHTIKEDPELYLDFSDLSEKNEIFVTSTVDAIKLYNETTTHNYEEINQTIQSLNNVKSFKNVSIIIDEQTDSERNLTKYTNMPIIFSNSVTTEELSYPETAKEIQEALGLMENSLSDITASGKVRRDVGDAFYDTVDRNNVSSLATSVLTDKKAPDLNKTSMLSMVMKYLPYLKPYENEILGNIAKSYANIGSTSSEYFIGSSLLLMLCLYC